jgi:hypothetical protein
VTPGSSVQEVIREWSRSANRRIERKSPSAAAASPMGTLVGPAPQVGQVGVGDLGGERLDHGAPPYWNGMNSSILSEQIVPFQC